MKVKWLKGHLLGAGKVAKAGEVSEELHPLEAQRKISMGYAEPLGADPVHLVQPAAPPAAPAVPRPATGAVPRPASSDPKPAAQAARDKQG